jgi:hypothetical protein
MNNATAGWIGKSEILRVGERRPHQYADIDRGL